MKRKTKNPNAYWKFYGLMKIFVIFYDSKILSINWLKVLGI